MSLLGTLRRIQRSQCVALPCRKVTNARASRPTGAGSWLVQLQSTKCCRAQRRGVGYRPGNFPAAGAPVLPAAITHSELRLPSCKVPRVIEVTSETEKRHRAALVHTSKRHLTPLTATTPPKPQRRNRAQAVEMVTYASAFSVVALQPA